MDGREIPGFYYDRAKKKYFRIQPDHLATPGRASMHSQSSVRAEKESVKRRRVEAREFQRIARERVRRTQATQSKNSIGAASVAEIGGLSTRTHTNDTNRQAFVAGLQFRSCPCRAYQSLMIDYALSWHQGPSVEALAYDAGTRSMVIGHRSDNSGAQRTLAARQPLQAPNEGLLEHLDIHSALSCLRTDYDYRSDFTAPILPGLTSPISSISITPSRCLLASTFGGERPATLVFMPLLEPRPWPDDTTDTHIGRGILQGVLSRMQPLDAQVCIQFDLTGQQTLFCSTPNDAASPENSGSAVFAAGGNDEAHIYATSSAQINKVAALATTSEFISCHWQDAHVLALGNRRGEAVLWDTRVGGEQASVKRFALPSSRHQRANGKWTSVRTESVAEIHCLPDTPQIVLRGGRDTAGLYDLRRVPEGTKKNRTIGTTPTIKYDWQGGHRGGAKVGFSVHERLNMVTMADEYGTVGVFEARSGKKMGVLETEAARQRKTTQPYNARRGSPVYSEPAERDDSLASADATVQCLKWVEREGEDVLLGAQGSSVIEWAW